MFLERRQSNRSSHAKVETWPGQLFGQSGPQQCLKPVPWGWKYKQSNQMTSDSFLTLSLTLPLVDVSDILYFFLSEEVVGVPLEGHSGLEYIRVN